MIKIEDDFFHDPAQWPGFEHEGPFFFNESGLFGFAVPEADLHGYVYVHHRANVGVLWAGVALWDKSGCLETDCLWHDFKIHRRPVGSECWNFTVPSGLTIQNVDPLKRYLLKYDATKTAGVGCSIDLEWNALVDPVDMPVPKEWIEWCPRHYDHIGKMTGTISVEGKQYEVNCYSGHDRSWGPQKMANTGRGTYACGGFSDDHLFYAQTISPLAPEEDPIFDIVDDLRAGWYVKDGVLADIVSGTRRTERGEDTRPLKEIIEGKDANGREFRFEGKVKNHLMFNKFSEVVWWWSGVEWTSSDGLVGHGETADTIQLQHLRRVSREQKKKGFSSGILT